VVIDRPQELVVDHLSPRNTYGFKVSRSYFQKPDGFRVKFLDATNDYKPAERLIPWPGHVGDIKLTEALELPGKTDPVEIFRESRRRMYEALHRPDIYQVSMDGPLSVATRGDRVAVSLDTIERTHVVGRVKSARGRLVELDEAVVMEAGQSYAIRFRIFEDAEDTVGSSLVRTVVTRPGETSLLLLVGDGALPQAGHLCHFGLAGSDSFSLVVSGIEAGQDMSCHLKLIDASPVIDQLTDALVIPTWSGRVGAEIDENLLTPATPRFSSISSGINGTDEAGQIVFLIEPGTGNIPVASFRVQHRLQGAPDWHQMTFPAANGGGSIPGYATGNFVQVRSYAVSADGIESVPSPVILFKVGAQDGGIPPALNASMIAVGPLLGGAVVQFATSDDQVTTSVQIYRSIAGILNRATDAVQGPISVEPSRSYSQPIGDTTRQNLLTNGGFDNATGWALGDGWSIASGKAKHAAGAGGTISQALGFEAGKWYRISLEVSDRVSGDVTPQLVGGSTRAGTVRSANGSHVDRIQAVTGNASFEFAASSSFDGAINNGVVYLETATCLSQGIHNIWLEPLNSDGVPGPVAGPFPVTVR
jgi:hypothetical protein